MPVLVQQRMPRHRVGHTTAVTIGGERFYITTNQCDNGTLGEVFIRSGKQGTSGAGLMDIYASALSAALQHGVPLADLIGAGLDLCFVPNGHTDDPEIPRARSVIDYISRRLALDWLPRTERAALGVLKNKPPIRTAVRDPAVRTVRPWTGQPPRTVLRWLLWPQW